MDLSGKWQTLLWVHTRDVHIMHHQCALFVSSSLAIGDEGISNLDFFATAVSFPGPTRLFPLLLYKYLPLYDKSTLNKTFLKKILRSAR